MIIGTGSITVSKADDAVTANLLMIQIQNRFCREAHTTKEQARKQLSTNIAWKQGAFGGLSQLITVKCILGIQVQPFKGTALTNYGLDLSVS